MANEIEINKTELAQVICDNYVAPGCEIINSDIAGDPEYQQMIRDRLAGVSDDSKVFGDISAELSRSAVVDLTSVGMLRNYLGRSLRL